jgi:type III pantothenate kinase
MSLALLLDCGNTRLKWCLLESGHFTDAGVELVSELNIEECLGRLPMKDVNKVFISSVNKTPKVVELFQRIEECQDALVYWVDHSFLAGEQFAYPEVNRLGIDRCLVILAARALSNDGVLIIDGGSAMTADILAPGGEHLGGYIFPGYRMLKNALISGTSNINLEHSTERSTVPGKDTESCVLNAVHIMQAQSLSFLESLCDEYCLDKIYLTGGDAEYIAGVIGRRCELRPDLVFEGIKVLACNLDEGPVRA